MIDRITYLEALNDLDLHHLYLIYPGQREMPLDKKITGIVLSKFITRFSGI